MQQMSRPDAFCPASPIAEPDRVRGGGAGPIAGAWWLRPLGAMVIAVGLGFSSLGCEEQGDDVVTDDETTIIGEPDSGSGDPAVPPVEPAPEVPPAERPGEEVSDPATGEVAMVERTVKVSLEVPDTAWSINIDEVYLINDDVLAVVARLIRPEDMMGGQMISIAEDTARVMAPADAEERVYVIGKTWNWENEGVDYIFLEDRDDLREAVQGAEKIYEFGGEGP